MSGNQNGRILLNVTYLKHLRKTKGLTQDDLAQDCRAKRLSLSIASIKRAESGQKVLYRTASNLAKYYGVNVSELFREPDLDSMQAATLSYQNSSLVKPNALAVPDRRANIGSEPGNQYGIALLIEDKSAGKLSVRKFLLELGVSFDNIQPYILMYIPQGNTALFRYFRHICLLLTETFGSRIRISAQWVRNRSVTEPVPTPLRDAVGLTAWGGISVCPYIAASGACRPIARIKQLAGLTGWRHASVSARPACFTGRQWELSQLHSCLDTIETSQRGVTVSLEGVEGIGKTALIHHFIDGISSRWKRIILLDLSCLRTARISPLKYLVRKLLKLPAEADATTIRHCITSSNISVTSQVFICAAAETNLLDTERRLLNAMGAKQRQLAVHGALTELIDWHLKDSQLILFIEDVYLADEDFTQIIKVLTLQTRNKPLMLCLSTRKTGKYTSSPAWLEHAHVMELSGLTDAECQVISKSLSPTDTRHRQQSLLAASGHPGYLVRLLQCNQLYPYFYATVDSEVDFKLKQLASMDRFALNVVAVFGKPFSLEQWHELVDPLLESPRSACNPQILINAQLLRQVSDTYTFIHPVVHRSVLQRIPKSELGLIARVVENWIEMECCADEVESTSALDKRDFDTLARKAQESANRFQYDRALEIYRAAAKIAPADAQAKLFNRTARCLLSQGRVADSLALHHQAIEAARLGAPGRYHIDLAHVYDLMGKHEKVLEVTEDVTEKALRRESGTRWDTLAEMHAIRASSRLYGGCLREARVDYQQALYCSSKTTNAAIKALAMSGIAKCCYAQGRIQESLTYYFDCLALCEKSGLLATESEVRAMLARIHYFRLETEPALQSGQQAVMLAHHTGNVRVELMARLSLAWILLESGSCNLAKREIGAGLKLARRAKALRYIAFFLESKARLLWIMGAHAKATAAINRALRIIKEQSLEFSMGSWLSATKARIGQTDRERYSALKQADGWLRHPTAIHNALNFYREAIHTAWQLGDAELLRKYSSQLNAYNQGAPTRWAEIHMNQANLMLDLLQGSVKALALKRFNEKVREYQMFRLQLDFATF